jgi:hypothetical protein
MSKNSIIALTALVIIAVLACSPTVIARDILGDRSIAASTNTLASSSPAAQAPTLGATLTSEPNPMLSFQATVTQTIQTAQPSATQATQVSPANTPGPILNLRDDLPPIALRDWPRPTNDNGRCIHFLPTGYYTQRDFDIQIPRMKDLQMRWVLALYSDENQLRLAASQFKAAGITPVWRKSMRAYQSYLSWGRDIQIIKDAGLPPYMQIYNEPDVEAEWDGREVDRDQWVASFLQSARDVYNSGGYVGLQVLDEAWLSAVIQAIKDRKGERLFGRMFFIPHSYGLNHPPTYVEDENGVLGFRLFADIFQKEIGAVPPFIVGEGGWQYKATDDNRFPIIDDKLHAQYHAAVFRWFIDGKLSDGKPLPDYLFAFCPWILAGQLQGAAWYDSFEGERTQTIQEVKKILPANAVRKFSWDKK